MFSAWKPFDKIPYKLDDKKNSSVWVVTEKVHGANFSVLCDGSQVAFAKRSRLLHEDESFYQYQRVMDDLSLKVFSLWNALEETGPIELVTVYGELFGGKYPEMSVSAVAGLHPVQTGIWYSPELVFMVFDVLVQTSSGTTFIPFLDMVATVERHGFMAVKPLFVGSRAQAFAYTPRFQSLIPQRLGLPPIAANLAEGVVVRSTGECRKLVKIKNKEFSEILDETEHAGSDIGPMLRRINEARCQAAISKVGPDTAVDEVSWHRD